MGILTLVLVFDISKRYFRVIMFHDNDRQLVVNIDYHLVKKEPVS